MRQIILHLDHLFMPTLIIKQMDRLSPSLYYDNHRNWIIYLPFSYPSCFVCLHEKKMLKIKI